jgi:hypothetical protein
MVVLLFRSLYVERKDVEQRRSLERRHREKLVAKAKCMPSF